MTILIEFAVVEKLVNYILLSIEYHDLQRLKECLASKNLNMPLVVGFDLCSFSRDISDCTIVVLSQIVHLLI